MVCGQLRISRIVKVRKLEEFDPPVREEINRNRELWWNRKLNRPLFHVAVRNAFESRLPEPKFAYRRLASNYPDEATIQDVFDSWEHDLSRQAFKSVSACPPAPSATSRPDQAGTPTSTSVSATEAQKPVFSRSRDCNSSGR
jgi:hypothetical protein